MAMLDDSLANYTWSVFDYEDTLEANYWETKSNKFTVADNPSIEWCLVLKRIDICGELVSSRIHDKFIIPIRKKSSDNIFSLYLENCKADSEHVSLDVDFSILDATDDKAFTRRKQISGVLVNATQYGFEKFISKKELVSDLSVDKCLKIRCDIISITLAVSENFHSLKGFDSDVTLFVNKAKLYAHKVILASKSSVFYKMFSVDMAESNSNEAIINDTGIDIFYEVLRFMYTGKVEKLDVLGLEIFKVAHLYEINDLKFICEHFLRKTLKIENSIDSLILADDYNAEYLKARCLSFISKNVKAVMETAVFKDIRESHPHHAYDLLVELKSNILK